MARITVRWVTFSTLTLLIACNTQTPPPIQLARDQTLRLPIYSTPSPGPPSLDPASLSDTMENAIGDNIFDGLYRFNEQMQEQPDIAKGMPSVSADGLTYIFHLRPNVRFWNGDPVTAADFVYSWNRAAAMGGDWSGIFQPVAGYTAVAAAGKITNETRLDVSAPDNYTLVARLSSASDFWLAELVLPAAWVVDQNAIAQGGTDQWWTKPNDLVGTGPFRMTDWTSNGDLAFAPVANWWNGSTGALTRVELHIVTGANDWTGYENGQFDIVGFGRHDFPGHNVESIAALRHNAARRSEVHTWPFGTTVWVGFNLQSGPFSGFEKGRQLRQAFSQAIDRNKLALAVCQDATICAPATGGMIAKGLHGYLGDGADPGAKFDPAGARATIKRIDPNGTLLKGITYYYPVPAQDLSQAAAENLAAQWLANLGIAVTIKALDPTTFFTNESYGTFTMWRQAWQGDYDHPQDWFDNLFIDNSRCGAPICTVYDRPGFRALIASADQKPLAAALPDYLRAGQMLAGDYAYAALYYRIRTVVIKPYVQGYGANALWENRWTSLRILQH
jgi:oligopeptide transport system substrate-binding protein